MIWLPIVLIVLFLVLFLVNYFQKRRVVSLFEKGNTLTSGMKGQGKDLLFCVVTNARKKNYVSNVQYTHPDKPYKMFNFDIKVWEISGNQFANFADNKLKRYVYPYPDDIDYYISDCGVYFPSSYCNDLMKRYGSSPFFLALSRHLGNANVHVNVQNPSRVWDKIREQSDLFIRMDGSKVFKLFGRYYYRLKGFIYDNYDSFEKRIEPLKIGLSKADLEAKRTHETIHGKIKKFSFFGKLPYQYDSRIFKKLLENGCIEYVNQNEKNMGNKVSNVV